MSAPDGFHDRRATRTMRTLADRSAGIPVFEYRFENFFHPFVGELIERLNQQSLAGLLDADFQAGLSTIFFTDDYGIPDELAGLVEHHPKEIDVTPGGPYANYNWELLFHVPLTIAVHLSKNQRFAEAQRWFHYIFDPTSNVGEGSDRYWKFLGFRSGAPVHQIDDLLKLISTPVESITDSKLRDLRRTVLEGYDASRRNPFQPHLIAATRPVAYQFSVVMKYLDNLVAWGDALFREDTSESINEAIQRYVLAANILGPRPERVPRRGSVRAKTFAELRDQPGGLDAMGNALVELEARLPLNHGLPTARAGVSREDGSARPVHGLGRTLYFCVPENDRLLGYWDLVGDRLFKIRNSMNLDGVARSLSPFDPPLDPGMLVKAAAAGIDISAAIDGMDNPSSPLRCLRLLQMARELCNEVKSLGSALLSAIEKGEGEHLQVLRAGHDTALQSAAQGVYFMRWKQAEASTDALIRSRGSALERYGFYQRLLGVTSEGSTMPFAFSPPTRAAAAGPAKFSEADFDKSYAELVKFYDAPVTIQSYPDLRLAGDSSPANKSGASGTGRLRLSTHEDVELNDHLPTARDTRAISSSLDIVAQVVTMIPDIDVDLHFWGLGMHSKVFGGVKLSRVSTIAAEVLRTMAAWHQDQAGMAARTATYERRVDEWMLQLNLAGRELLNVGRQILASLIAESTAHQEYLNVKAQIGRNLDVERVLSQKFTTEEMYGWMQGELVKLFYDYYGLAFDTARKAEQAMKRELMREEVDATSYIQARPWNEGRRGLLAGEPLALDLARMELAYHQFNQRELEITKNVSLRQLDPLALLELRSSADHSCEVQLPEVLFDMDCPGHYMRRLKQVSVSIPAVVGPYVSVNCTLSLLRSTVRTSPVGSVGSYARKEGGDTDRFRDFYGTIESIVTSTANADSGLFETPLSGDRLLPFEGSGAVSTWKLQLGAALPQFDYDSISDVVLQVRYTARDGGEVLRQGAIDQVGAFVAAGTAAGSSQLLSARQDFPAAWSRFSASGAARARLQIDVRPEHYPFWSRNAGATIEVHALVEPNGDAEPVQVFYGAAPPAHDGEAVVDPSDELLPDATFGALSHGRLANLPNDAPVQTIDLYLDPSRTRNLWLIITSSRA